MQKTWILPLHENYNMKLADLHVHLNAKTLGTQQFVAVSPYTKYVDTKHEVHIDSHPKRAPAQACWW